MVITLIHNCFYRPWINITALHSGSKHDLNKVDLSFCGYKMLNKIDLQNVYENRFTKCIVNEFVRSSSSVSYSSF